MTNQTSSAKYKIPISLLDYKAPISLLDILPGLIISAVIALTAVLLFATIRYRDTKLGLYIIGGALALALAFAIAFRPQLGAYALILVIFSNLSATFTVSGLPSINKPLVALVLVSLIANRVLKRKFRGFGYGEWLMVAYLGVWILSAFVAEDKNASVELILDLAKDLIIVACIVQSLDQLDHWKSAIWVIIGAATFLALLGDYQALTRNYSPIFGQLASVSELTLDGSGARLAGPINEPNFWGQTLVAILPLALYRFLHEQKPILRLATGASIVICGFAVLNTFSRGAYIAAIGMLILVFLDRRVQPIISAALLVIGLGVILILPAQYKDRWGSLTGLQSQAGSAGQDLSLIGRTSEIKAGLLMFEEHPILGIGIGNYKIRYQEYTRRLGLEFRTGAREAHSTYTQILAETGLIGMAVYIALFGWLLLELRRTVKRLRQHDIDSSWLVALQIAIICYLTSSLFLHQDFIRYLWLLVALSFAGINISQTLLYQQPPALPRSQLIA